MPIQYLTAKPNPTGTKLVRLDSIPPNQLSRAARTCMAEAKDPAEWLRFFTLWHNPGNTSGRIA